MTIYSANTSLCNFYIKTLPLNRSQNSLFLQRQLRALEQFGFQSSQGESRSFFQSFEKWFQYLAPFSCRLSGTSGISPVLEDSGCIFHHRCLLNYASFYSAFQEESHGVRISLGGESTRFGPNKSRESIGCTLCCLDSLICLDNLRTFPYSRTKMAV